MAKFRVVVEIEAPTVGDADELRDEIVGAVEDNHESGSIDAKADVGDLEEVK